MGKCITAHTVVVYCCLFLNALNVYFWLLGVAVGICGLCNHPHGAVTAPT